MDKSFKKKLLKAAVFCLPVAGVILALHPGLASATTIPMSSQGGDALGQVAATAGQSVSNDTNDAMYFLYALAGVGGVVTVLEYFLMKEHKKTIYTTGGIALASGLAGGYINIVSHGQSGNGASGAMITAAHHAVIFSKAYLGHHLHRLKK